jgi:adenosylhomocysteine nucleosidase
VIGSEPLSVTSTRSERMLEDRGASAPTVGVVVALPEEARCLISTDLELGRPVTIHPQMWICLGGIGGDGAAASCVALIAAGATALVSWGIAAGLDPALRAGALVLSSDVLRASDVGLARAALANSESTAWAQRIADRVVTHIPTIVRAPIAHADRLLRTPADKRALARTGAAAADMETASVAQAANVAGIPWLAIRAISDTAEVALPTAVMGAVDQHGRVQPTRLIGALLRHPAELLRLPRLAREFRSALRTLRIVAGEAGPTLLATGSDGTVERVDRRGVTG